MNQTLDAMAIRHVFGEPIERDGVTYLPAAKVRGGGGGGGDTEGNGGAGFGVASKPAGVYVIRDGDAEWRPAHRHQSHRARRPARGHRGAAGPALDPEATRLTLCLTEPGAGTTMGGRGVEQW